MQPLVLHFAHIGGRFALLPQWPKTFDLHD
jgi:hypothetical protein